MNKPVVLVVEDEPLLRLFASDMIEEACQSPDSSGSMVPILARTVVAKSGMEAA